MIDAKQAAAPRFLPAYYWFADHAMRSKYRIPHYLMGGLVRYRLSELSAWAARSTAVQGRPADDTDAAVEGGRMIDFNDTAAPAENTRRVVSDAA